MSNKDCERKLKRCFEILRRLEMFIDFVEEHYLYTQDVEEYAARMRRGIHELLRRPKAPKVAKEKT